MVALYISGMRVETRDAEWRIQRVERCVDGRDLLHCMGLSELVRGRIVFTPSKGLFGVGLPSKALKDCTHYHIEWPGQGPAPLDVPLPSASSCAERPQQDTLGWDDIKHLPQDFMVIRTSPDETLPDDEGNNTVITRETQYHAPFVKPDREKDCEIVWGVLAGDKDQ